LAILAIKIGFWMYGRQKGLLLEILKILPKKGDKKGYFCQICGDFLSQSSGHPAYNKEKSQLIFL